MKEMLQMIDLVVIGLLAVSLIGGGQKLPRVEGLKALKLLRFDRFRQRNVSPT